MDSDGGEINRSYKERKRSYLPLPNIALATIGDSELHTEYSTLRVSDASFGVSRGN